MARRIDHIGRHRRCSRPDLIVWDQFINVPKEATEVEAFGVQWNWSFRLPGADGKLGSSDVRYIDGDNPLGVSPADPKSMDDIIITNGELHLPVEQAREGAAALRRRAA